MKKIIVTDYLICRICGQSHLTVRDRNRCIVSHGKDIAEYFIEHYLDNNPFKCKCGCGTLVDMKIVKNEIRYSDYTTNHFPRKPHTEETKKKIKENTQKAIREKYGVDNVYTLKRIKDKIKKTNQEKYGFDNPMQNEHIKQKSHHYHTEESKNKIRNTNLDKFGANSYTSSDEGKIRIRNINLEKWGEDNPAKVDIIKEKIANTNIKKMGYTSNFNNPEFIKLYKNKASNIQKTVCEKLCGELNYIYEGREYDIKLDNYLIEIDGDYWHQTTLNNLTLSQIQTAINDIQKYKIVNALNEYELLKIKVSELPEIITLDGLKKNSYIPIWNLEYNAPILTKEYLKKYINERGSEKLEQYIPLLLKFIRTFQPEFPIPTSNENPTDIINYINKLDTNRINLSEYEFSNHFFNNGVSYLKSLFPSYWKSSFKGNKSPVEAWKDDTIMTRIIKYRIGLNSSNEIFDFSLKTLITGLTVNRFSVSFFKPTLAAAIYHKFLGNNEMPVVLDPCAGFGGRLLGFKSKYPNGTYVGLEPNKETYESLVNMVNELKLTNVQLYNIKAETFQSDVDYDLVFTSIPYYDLENYNNEFDYASIEEWSTVFINSFLKYKNLVLNTDVKTFEYIKDKFTTIGKIFNNTSPLVKTDNQNYELLITK